MKLYKLFIVLACLLVAQSCEQIVGGDINRDPNNPTSVPVTALMPAFQIALADTYGGTHSRINCMLSQQVEGVERQWSSFNQYTGLTANRFDTDWATLYQAVLNELHIGRAAAVEAGLNHTGGIIDVTEAFALMMGTDVWDDMPYSDALQGIAQTNPTYDTQSAIYGVLNGFLDSGLSKLNGPVGSVAPGAEDVYYGGSASKWIKAAHAIKARGMLHNKDYAGAMSEAMQSFESPADNMQYNYPDAGAAAPWYRFNDGRTGDIEFHPTMRGIMEGLNDTDRLAVADVIFVTDAGTPFMDPAVPSELITYREMQFIIAEADVRNGGSQVGYDAYLAGIKASFQRFGLGDAEYDAYVAQDAVNPGVGSLTLEHVMTQKYIGMFLQPEVFSDYRRTNIPVLEPVSGANVIVRWDYPATENLFNSNAPAAGSVNLFADRVGWNR